MAKKPSKTTLRKRFDLAIKTRLKAEHGRTDAVKWLAEKMHSSEAYVSQMLNCGCSRRYHDDRPFPFWKRLCTFLTTSEIKTLEEMEK